MIKKQIYPKTQRLKNSECKVQITEKLDGSNLVIFKKDDVLCIAQRNNILTFEEALTQQKDILYKGLYQWLIDNSRYLTDNLHDRSAICGEWLGMGQLKYSIDEFDKRFYMFAKANIEDNFNLYNIIYDDELFIYPFIEQKIPNFIGIVPVVKELNILPSKEQLDGIYSKYTQKVGRNVEGFVVNYRNQISKYVRMKNGKLKEHFNWEENNVQKQ